MLFITLLVTLEFSSCASDNNKFCVITPIMTSAESGFTLILPLPITLILLLITCLCGGFFGEGGCGC